MTDRREGELAYRTEDFVADGSLRDVCVLDTALDDWQHMLEGLRTSPWKHIVTWTLSETTESDVPDARAVWSLLDADPEDSLSLAMEIERVWFTCYFFDIGEIEFTFDPADVVDDTTFAPVRDFVKWLGHSTSREVIVTMEGSDHASMPPLLRLRCT